MKNILEINHLSFSYKYQTHQATMTFRDLFVQGLQNPIRYFKAYDELPILKNINLTLRAGDRLALTGVNGSGKTTLCRIILGIIQSQKGSVRVAGSLRGILSSGGLTFPELTGRENANVIVEILYPELSNNDKKLLIKECLNFSELGYYLDVPFQFYSKGMQNRLFLSLISARTSDLLILDEVFDGADAAFQEKIEKRFLNMIDQGQALLFVSHSEDNIKKVCNKRALLQNGELILL